MTDDDKRLIEVAFPLKQVSLDSVHEKNVRHGHISTLHIWPARRPLAACRAALICTLLPDPGDQKQRKEILRRLAGRVVQDDDGRETTTGGILHWGRENGPDLDWFREKIRQAYGGKAPKVLDPFAGGGAIPLEAMRLGCEATAVDINPVAWFILKCTLEYPHRLAGRTRPLPDFALEDPGFMDDYLKHLGYSEAKRRDTLRDLGLRKGEPLSHKQVMFEDMSEIPEADLAWHVRAWGRRVLERARRELAAFYPTYASFERPNDKRTGPLCDGEIRLVPPGDDGRPDVDALNAEYDEQYLEDESNPRWMARPTVAYLWARTVPCKNCRGTAPLLKTQWLCRKKRKRVLLTVRPNDDETGVVFGVEDVTGDKERERELLAGAGGGARGGGTMSRSGATCPLCGTIMTMSDLRAEGKRGHLGQVMTAVVVAGQNGKEYRPPTDHEREMARKAGEKVEEVFADIPFGVPDEPLPSENALGMRIPKYGFKTWGDLFTPRQLLALGVFVETLSSSKPRYADAGYPVAWSQALYAYLAVSVDRLADRCSTLCTWDIGYEKINHTFSRYALPICWDYAEVNTLSDATGNYYSAVEWATRYIAHGLCATNAAPVPYTGHASATSLGTAKEFDLVLTDPPYYDAIPYSDLMDFFYIWLKRTVAELNEEFSLAFDDSHTPKWDHDQNDGELIEDESRFGGNQQAARDAYEHGMYRAFLACHNVLKEGGLMGLVFANKQPDAWETLVAALVRAGFFVDASWPIATEMGSGLRHHGRASLGSSVWLVCRKRPKTARPGWYDRVLEEMRERMRGRLRDFWDAGIRGPDFVWAATGPALESYSRHPVVKNADRPGETMSVGEFLQHVRRFVVDFQVGRVLSAESEDRVGDLDDVTSYYLLHRKDFGMDAAPAGAVILYALSCGLSDSDLAGRCDLISKSGSSYTLKPWHKRTGRDLGDTRGDEPPPLIDRIHKLMHLWRAGDVRRVDEYVDRQGLRLNELFSRVLQAIIELSSNQERSTLESISNHLKTSRPTKPKPKGTQGTLGDMA